MGTVALLQHDPAQARTYFAEGLSLCRDLGDRFGMAMNVRHLGEVARRQGDYPTAHALFAESLVCFRETGSTWGVAECLIGLARVAEAQGQLERAVRLFGAAESLRIASGAHMDPAERADDDRRLAAARSHLDDARFASMWAAGQAMSLEQAIAEALNTTTRNVGHS
jgi:tetratricopeptide (TPR) repeat protein